MSEPRVNPEHQAHAQVWLVAYQAGALGLKQKNPYAGQSEAARKAWRSGYETGKASRRRKVPAPPLPAKVARPGFRLGYE